MSSEKVRKSEKRMRGVPVHYDELKKKHGVWLTESTWSKLQELAKEDGVSVGEYIERLVRGIGG